MNNLLNVSKAATKLSVGVKTMQRWEREGVLIPVARSATNRRLYSEEQLAAFAGTKPAARNAKTVAYCRVSSPAQKPDLKNQRQVLELFTAAKGLGNVEFVDEVGGGLNFQRKKFLALMEAVGRGEIKTLVVAHRDRLTRFGFEWFEHYAALHGCEIVVLNHEHLSPEEEMVQDLMTIVDCFSSRLYGLRNYRKKLGEALAKDVHAPAGP